MQLFFLMLLKINTHYTIINYRHFIFWFVFGLILVLGLQS